MLGDDLHTPLGLDLDRAEKPRKAIVWKRLGLGTLAVLVAGFAARVRFFDDGMGGEPFAVAKIETAPVPAPPVSPAPVAAPPVTIVTPGVTGADTTGSIRVTTLQNRDNAAEIESRSGVRVVRQGGGETPGGLIIQIPRKQGVELAPAPDRRLVEKGKYGPLPKIGADGARPVDVYARPVVMSLGMPARAPRIALVVGGMGLSATATRLAMDRLPPETTFAFAPYGSDLERQVARARSEGHEVILQLPMEGSEGADPNGSRTLDSALTAEQLQDRLFWHLSRFSGYVGVENFMGQRFTAREDLLTPVMREVVKRGLLYLDDGSSPSSIAPVVGGGLGAPIARADIVIDADRSPEAVTAALTRLEAIAREKGIAIGTMSALPGSVEQAAKFLQGLEKRGISLTPLSAFAGRSPVPSARLGR